MPLCIFDSPLAQLVHLFTDYSCVVLVSSAGWRLPCRPVSTWGRTKGSLAPCLVAARAVCWRPCLAGTPQYITDHVIFYPFPKGGGGNQNEMCVSFDTDCIFRRILGKSSWTSWVRFILADLWLVLLTECKNRTYVSFDTWERFKYKRKISRFYNLWQERIWGTIG